MFKKPILKKIFYTFLLFVNALALFIFLQYGVVFIAYYPALLILLFILLKGLLRWVYKRKNDVFKANITLSLTTIFIVLFIAETVLRFSNVYKDVSERELMFFYKSQHVKLSNGWYQVWNKDHFLGDGVRFNHFRKINSEGLSDVECPIVKTNNEVRILGIGDSFTEGHGADADSTWLKFLERKMKSDTCHLPNLKFINAGVCGSDPFFEYVLLRDKLIKYKPDIAIFQFCENDISDVILRGGMDRFRKNGRVKYLKGPTVTEFFFASSFVLRILNPSFLMRFQGHNLTEIQYAFKEFSHFFKLLNELAVANKIQVYLCFLPTNFNQNSNDELFVFQPLMQKYPDLIPISFHSYLKKNKWLYEKRFRKTGYWENNGHYNAKGYEILADAIFEVIKNDSLLQNVQICDSIADYRLR